jgi:PBP1b-binding outer membrane lipoprotein LpoB
MKLIVLSAFVLAGCAQIPTTVWKSVSPEEKAQYEKRDAEEAERNRTAYIDSLRAQCQAIGFKPEDMPNCMMRMHELNLQASQAKRQSDVAAGSALMGYGASMSAIGQRQFAPTTGFTCFRNGPMVTCR